MRYNKQMQNERKKGKNIFHKVIGLCIFAVIVIIAYNIFLIAISGKSENQKYIFGMKAYIVETNSMEPTLKQGDVIIIKKCERDELKVGDVITFQNRGELVTHRITEINSSTQRYTTKGDKNALKDIEAVKFKDIEGKMILRIPKFWKIIKEMQNIMYGVIIFILIITLFLHNRRTNRKSMMRRRKKKELDKFLRENNETNENKQN